VFTARYGQIFISIIQINLSLEVLQFKGNLNFMVAPCINNIKHFIVQLMHTNYKILRLLKQLKL